MRANRYLAVIVGAALAVSFALPGAVSAQEEKYMQGWSAYSAGNFAQAETIFREVCAEYEDAGAPWGWCHMMLGATLAQQRAASKRQEALAQLGIAEDLVTSDEDRYMVYSTMAQIHLLNQSWDQAIRAADEAARFGGADQQPAIAKTKGQAYYQQGNYPQAVTELTKAVAARSGEANLHAWLGRSLYETGNKAKALEELTTAAQIDRSNKLALYFAARIQYENGNYRQAVLLGERAIQAHPQDATIRDQLGLAYLAEERYDEAIRQFEVVIAERPNNASAIYNLGQAYLAMENWGRAAEQFQKAQNLFPAGSANQGKLLYDLGVALERLGRNDDALRAFRDSAAINETTDVLDAIDRVEERIRRGKNGGGR
jgi:tetratricopeptide (TPR) repeat protein